MKTSKYEVTTNPTFPTTETTDIPKEWVQNKCEKCGAPIFIDRIKKVIHHKDPFCNWFHKAWVTPVLMKHAVESWEEENRKEREIKKLEANMSYGTEFVINKGE